jgi:putative endonuclease
VARRHLSQSGLLPVKTNWRGRGGELDLVALDKRTLVIVEVKTRHISLKDEYPAISAITHEKRQRLESLGRSFQRNHGPFCRRYAIKTRRTDVIEVYYSRSRWGGLRRHSVYWHRGVARHQ